MPQITANKKALHDYQILEKLEAGLVLTGAEVKAIKNGQINLKVKSALANSLVPIVCVGETFAERQEGNKDFIISQQVGRALARAGRKPAKLNSSVGRPYQTLFQRSAKRAVRASMRGPEPAIRIGGPPGRGPGGRSAASPFAQRPS